MKRFFLILLIALGLAISSSAQSLKDFQQKQTLIETKIELAKSEIKTSKLKLKIDKNDADALYIVSSNNEKIKALKNDLKNVKLMIKYYQTYTKSLNKFNTDKLNFEQQLEIYKKID